MAKLEVEIVGDARSLRRALKDSEKATKGFGATVGRTAKMAGLAAGGAGIGGLAVALKIGISEFNDAQKVAAQTNAVLKSTGGIANVSAKQVSALSESLMRKSGIDDEVIASGENVLLTFGKIRNEVGKGNDIFNQATTASLDLSVAFGKDMQSSAILVGKALQDPIKGLTALNRVGITFTEQQKEQIKQMMKVGDVAGAQKLILAELNRQVGGSAEALGNTLGGQINIVREQFNNWAGDIVSRMIPSLTRLANWVTGTMIPAFRTLLPALQAIGDAIRNLAQTAQQEWPKVKAAAANVANWYRDNLKPTMNQALDALTVAHRKWGGDAGGDLQKALGNLLVIQKNFWQNFSAVYTAALALLRGDWREAWGQLRSIVTRSRNEIGSAVDGLAGLVVGKMKALGAAMIQGLVAGLKSLGSSVTAALGDVVDGAVNSVKGKLGIRSPSRLMAEQVGLPMAQGVAAGILSGKTKVSEAMVQAANAAVDSARTVLQNRMGELGTWLQRAFQMKQGGVQTPTELLISQKELDRQTKDLADAITRAQADLVEARKSGKPADIAAAQRALDDAQYNQWLAGAQRQAQAERADLENRQFVEQQAFEKRLGQLNSYLNSGHATAKGARARIAKLEKDFGLTGGSMAAELGAGFVQGLRLIEKSVVAAAVALRDAVAREGVIVQGRKITIVIEEKAEKKKKKKGEGAGGPADQDFGSVSAPGVVSSLWDEIGMGQSMGLTLTSGRRGPRFPGDNSKHIYGKAIDMAGAASSMARFAKAAMGRPGIEDVFYSPLGGRFYWPDHYDHVHVEAFQKGGIVGGTGPQLIMAHGGETVLPARQGAIQVNLNVDGTTLAKVMVDPLRRQAKIFQRQNGRSAF